MADIENSVWDEVAANNIQPAPGGWPPNSSPNIVYSTDREMMGAIKREWNRSHPTVSSGGSANAQTLTYTVAPTAYYGGHSFAFIAGFTNTGPLTLNVNGLGAKNVFLDGYALQGGEVRAGLIVEVFFDGTQFQITSGRNLLSLGPSFGAMRNLLINPLFNVQQRGAQGSFSLAVAASSSPYTLDRWYIRTLANEGCTVGTSPLFGFGLGPYGAGVTRNPGQTGTGQIIFGQTLDTDMIQVLSGQTVTATVVVQAAAGFQAGAIGLSVSWGTGPPARVSSFVGQTVALSAFGTPTPGGAAVTITATGTIPTNARQVEFDIQWSPTGTAPANDTLNIYLPRLTLGSFDFGADLTRVYSTELPICQRFFQKSFPLATVPAQAAASGTAPLVQLPTGSSGVFALDVRLAPTMRGTPTITMYNPISANTSWRDITNNADRAGGSGNVSDNHFFMNAAGGVAGSTNIINWTADAEIL